MLQISPMSRRSWSLGASAGRPVVSPATPNEAASTRMAWNDVKTFSALARSRKPCRGSSNWKRWLQRPACRHQSLRLDVILADALKQQSDRFALAGLPDGGERSGKNFVPRTVGQTRCPVRTDAGQAPAMRQQRPALVSASVATKPSSVGANAYSCKRRLSSR